MTRSPANLLMDIDELGSRFPLELGTSAPLLIRHESILLGLAAAPIKLLFASDLHLGAARSQRAIAQLTAAARTTNPHLIVLGGDLVDSHRGLRLLPGCIEQLSRIAPVWAIAGNHDHWVGVAQVQQAVQQGGGQWLETESIDLHPGSLRLDGRLQGQTDASHRILCAHNPAVFEQAIAAGYALVLAGHLHGCQWVLGQANGRLYPGAWFYRWNGLRFEEKGATLLVSRGIEDTLPVRWNCPREVILCQIF